MPDYRRVDPERIEPSPRVGDTVASILAGAVPLQGRELTGVIDGAKLFSLIERLSDAE